ncbi:hypothetical protein AMJ87_08250 [candidate division WOR_3 bacterium SM23_60]|uniref:Carrier domain-containing protein n=1 Tax=candidate division WOR_3 bacterium SM23_60 TaxID=1703780 RepID=A0A0S8GDQ0_UNCW3|nr:MAG: hypothetical protein AMJ87_08250 [candidate division WOR_3 bacterium SM23_60]
MSDDLKKLLIDYVKKEYLEEDSEEEVDETFVEKKFNIKIPDEKATTEAFDSVSNIIKLLKEYNVS